MVYIYMIDKYDVHNYGEFKELFKMKYWLESARSIVKHNLCNGRYDEASHTTYFLKKVCITRHLEQKISDECLINKLPYHYEGRIVPARLNTQIEMIQAMSALLESYKH